MLHKVEITTDDATDAGVTPTPGPDGQTPEFGDHVNAPTSPDDNAAQPAPGTEAPQPANAGQTGANGDAGTSAYITALQAELEEARANADDAKKAMLYAQAEFQNYRRRTEDQNKDLQKFANRELIVSLLPVIDNFERALQAAEQTKSYDGLIGGVSSTLKQLQTMLQKAGVTPIESVGKEFDPNYHEAIGYTEEDSEHPANTVAEEMQRGYVMHDRVLRPSLVKVSQG